VVEALLRGFQPIRVKWALAVLPLAFVLGPVSVRAPMLALGMVLGALFIALTFIDLAAGLAAFTLLTFFERLPGIPPSQLSAIKIAGLILVVAWIARVAGTRGVVPLVTRDNPVIAYAAAALLAVAASSMAWAADGHVAEVNALRLAQGPVLLLVVFSALRTPQHLRWMLCAYFAGAVATALVGIGKTPADQADIGRFSGGIQDPNELAAALIPAVPIGLALIAIVRKTPARYALAGGLLLISAALFMTGSRGGLIGLGVMCVVGIMLAGPLRQQVVLGVAIVTGIAVTYYALFAPPEVLWRITHFTAEGGSGREDLWSIALAMFRDHPLLGVGAGNFQVLEPVYALSSINVSNSDAIVDAPRWVHNTYLHVLVELGILGLACFAVVVIGAFASGVQAVKRLARAGDRETEILARGFVIGITGLLTAFTFITAQYEKELWLLLGATLALRTVARATEGSPDT
jgi:O-antigen ligase